LSNRVLIAFRNSQENILEKIALRGVASNFFQKNTARQWSALLLEKRAKPHCVVLQGSTRADAGFFTL
jgi:hypothetical protein